jgi:hypothetical protein
MFQKSYREGGKEHGKEESEDLYVPGMRRLPKSKRVSFAKKRGGIDHPRPRQESFKQRGNFEIDDKRARTDERAGDRRGGR